MPSVKAQGKDYFRGTANVPSIRPSFAFFSVPSSPLAVVLASLRRAFFFLFVSVPSSDARDSATASTKHHIFEFLHSNPTRTVSGFPLRCPLLGSASASPGSARAFVRFQEYLSQHSSSKPAWDGERNSLSWGSDEERGSVQGPWLLRPGVPDGARAEGRASVAQSARILSVVMSIRGGCSAASYVFAASRHVVGLMEKVFESERALRGHCA